MQDEIVPEFINACVCNAETRFGTKRKGFNPEEFFMKHPHTSFIALLIGVMTTAGFSQAPAVRDGSNWSRAPIPAKRQFDDIKSPDAQAIDAVAPDAVTVMPPPRVVIMQDATAAPAYAATTTTTTTTYTEPALTPTGRPTVVVAPAAPAVEVRSERRFTEMTPPAVQDGSNWSRAPLPAKRQFNDVKSPDGQAIDQLPEVPPNSGR
jgi:hypothetical protein